MWHNVVMASKQDWASSKPTTPSDSDAKRHGWKSNSISLGGNFVFFAFFYGGLYWIYRRVSSSDAVAVCVVGILMTGLLLFGMRRGARLWYGMLEIVSALFIGWFTVTHALHIRHVTFAQFVQSPNSLSTLLGLVSSIYIVVRGLDNVAEGSKQHKEARDIAVEDKT